MNLPNETKAKLLQTISSLPPARIGFYGETGVGKSTIIDRLLGVNLLKSPAMSGGTKMIVELVPHFDTTRDDYIFDFISVSEETVKDWLKQAKSEAQHWRDQSAVHPETSGTGSASDFLKWFVTNLTNEGYPILPSLLLPLLPMKILRNANKPLPLKVLISVKSIYYQNIHYFYNPMVVIKVYHPIVVLLKIYIKRYLKIFNNFLLLFNTLRLLVHFTYYVHYTLH